MTRYIALLRGINVGGNNVIKMSALKACFEANGFEDVSTYIASGNVLFSSAEQSAARLCTRIEELLSAEFKYRSVVMLRSEKQLRATVERAPKGFGSQPAKYRYDVCFLKPPTTAASAAKAAPAREGVDQVWAGPAAIYYSRLIARITQSHLNKIIATPIYRDMTVRNWNTTTRLVKLLDE